MITVAFALFVALVTACTPLFVRYVRRFDPHISSGTAGWQLTSIAAICIAVSVFLPDVHISSQTHTFQQHFVGGGMYAACLFIYVRQLLGWRLHRFTELLMLFAWVSTFGVAVELLEFLATEAAILHLANADTDWDLLANTLGAFTLFFLYYLLHRTNKDTKTTTPHTK